MTFKFEKWESKNKNSWFSCIPGKNGFLPVGNPLKNLPLKYNIINEILDNMKITKNKNEKGLLFYGKLCDKINKDLPIFDLNNETDTQLLAALHRDYCFMASAYSLESSHIGIINSNDKYGIAKDELPPQISIPLLCLSKKNDVYPWLDYAYGYGLNNSIFEGDDIKNHKCYKAIRMFNGIESENGFINVHVAMVAQSGELLKYQQECLQYISENNRVKFNESLNNHYNIFYSIVDTLQTMWKASKYNEYLSFRTFIMGQTGNKKCYPEEIIKYNTDKGIEIHSYRGETGAQDSLIPSIDSFLQLIYPRNKLTEYLFDLRKYRPKDHQEYINFMKENSERLEFKNYCLKDTNSCIILLKNLNCLRMFRKKHWNLTKKYIIHNTKHPVATGGTPITTWLPNQLGATLEYMSIVLNNINVNEVLDNDIEFYKNIKIDLEDHICTIMDEVNMMQKEFKNQNHEDFLKR